jgi:hypothetical protein
VNRCVLNGFLHEGDVWQSVRNLLTTFRNNLRLEKLQFLCADWLVRNDEIYDENWNDAGKNHNVANNPLEMEVQYWRETGKISPSTSNTRLLEMYVLGFCDWPMAEEIPEVWEDWMRLPKYEPPEEDTSDSESSEACAWWDLSDSDELSD